MIGKGNNPKILLEGDEWIIEGFSVSELNHLYLKLYNPKKKKWSNHHIQKNYNQKNNIFIKLLSKGDV